MSERVPDDVAAFCAREYPRLVGALHLYVGDLWVAQELAQEALLKACRSWSKVGRLESPGGWTHRVALNLANSHFRRRRAESRARSRVGPPVTEHHDHDAADQVAVRRAIATLTVPQRTALVYRYFLDLSVDETARQMSTTSEAVRALTKRALAVLRTEFRDDLTDEPGEVTRAN